MNRIARGLINISDLGSSKAKRENTTRQMLFAFIICDVATIWRWLCLTHEAQVVAQKRGWYVAGLSGYDATPKIPTPPPKSSTPRLNDNGHQRGWVAPCHAQETDRQAYVDQAAASSAIEMQFQYIKKTND